ncbi:putative 1,3-beta-glucan synthase [Helianthus debilis subsp. tardiflorus]
MTSGGRDGSSSDYFSQQSAQEPPPPPPPPLPSLSKPPPPSILQPQSRLNLRKLTAGSIGESVFNSEVVPSSLAEIAPILRVANEVEPSNPRVAYLCKFYCFRHYCVITSIKPSRGVRA